MPAPSRPYPPVSEERERAVAALAQDLRTQIADRIRGEHQLVVVAASLAGATGSFAGSRLSSHPEVLALLCLLFVGFALAVLRLDQEITIIASHLLDRKAFRAHAEAQAEWECRKFQERQGTRRAWLASVSQTTAIYAVPVIAASAFAWAAIASPGQTHGKPGQIHRTSHGPMTLAWMILSVAFVLALLFIFGAIRTWRSYLTVGEQACAFVEPGWKTPSLWKLPSLLAHAQHALDRLRRGSG